MNCTICGCSSTLFDPKTGRCIRQGCVCPGCVFDSSSLGRGTASNTKTGQVGGQVGDGLSQPAPTDKPTGKPPAKVQ